MEISIQPFLQARSCPVLSSHRTGVYNSRRQTRPSSERRYDGVQRFRFRRAWVQSYLDDCIRRGESRGFAQLDKLTPEQRLGLESRGLLPKSDGAPVASK